MVNSDDWVTATNTRLLNGRNSEQGGKSEQQKSRPHKINENGIKINTKTKTKSSSTATCQVGDELTNGDASSDNSMQVDGPNHDDDDESLMLISSQDEQHENNDKNGLIDGVNHHHDGHDDKDEEVENVNVIQLTKSFKLDFTKRIYHLNLLFIAT